MPAAAVGARCQGGVQAVETGEVPVALLTKGQAEIDEEEAAGLHDTIQGQPTARGKLLVRRIREVWLEAPRHDANRTEM